jgi:hypothetical protein
MRSSIDGKIFTIPTVALIKIIYRSNDFLFSIRSVSLTYSAQSHGYPPSSTYVYPTKQNNMSSIIVPSRTSSNSGSSYAALKDPSEGAYYHIGIGGSGNYRKGPTSTFLEPLVPSTASLRSNPIHEDARSISSGIGGAGNFYTASEASSASFSSTTKVVRRETYGYGRGGAGNHTKAAKAREEKRGLFDKFYSAVSKRLVGDIAIEASTH